MITLPEFSLYKMIDQYASNSNANLDWDTVSIHDIFYGCAKFKQYGYDDGFYGGASSSGYLTYPEPGYDMNSYCMDNIDRCRNIRLSTSTIVVGRFDITLIAYYGQNPLTVPYVYEVTPCRNA